MKEQQYYFSHDASAKDDPKCLLLIDQLGLEGYGIFWILVETLRVQSDFKYPISLIPSLARRYYTTAEKMQLVVSKYGLFEIEDDLFFSLSLMERMKVYENKKLKKSEAGKLGMQKRWQNDNTVITPLLQNDNTVITNDNYKRKEKEKENKIKENKKIEEKSNTHTLKNQISNQTLDFVNDNFKDSFYSYLNYRKDQHKFEYKTESSIKLVYDKLIELSNSNPNEATLIVNQSIINGWKALFNLKEVNNANSSRNSKPNKYPGGCAAGDNKESDYDSYFDPKAWEF